MRKLLGFFFCIGMVAVFSGCGGGDEATSSGASSTTVAAQSGTVAQSSTVAQSAATVAKSVEILYFGSPG